MEETISEKLRQHTMCEGYGVRMGIYHGHNYLVTIQCLPESVYFSHEGLICIQYKGTHWSSNLATLQALEKREKR